MWPYISWASHQHWLQPRVCLWVGSYPHSNLCLNEFHNQGGLSNITHISAYSSSLSAAVSDEVSELESKLLQYHHALNQLHMVAGVWWVVPERWHHSCLTLMAEDRTPEKQGVDLRSVTCQTDVFSSESVCVTLTWLLLLLLLPLGAAPVSRRRCGDRNIIIRPEADQVETKLQSDQRGGLTGGVRDQSDVRVNQLSLSVALSCSSSSSWNRNTDVNFHNDARELSHQQLNRKCWDDTRSGGQGLLFWFIVRTIYLSIH